LIHLADLADQVFLKLAAEIEAQGVPRKVVADMQNRIGPNRVGPYGILQPVADGLKSLTKEDIVPFSADGRSTFCWLAKTRPVEVHVGARDPLPSVPSLPLPLLSVRTDPEPCRKL